MVNTSKPGIRSRFSLIIFLTSLILVFFILSSAYGCIEQRIAPTYDFNYVFSNLMNIDAKYNTSFFNETMSDPIGEEMISGLLEEIRLLQMNNEKMNISTDYHSINVLLDFRKILLLSQRNFGIFNHNFVGRYKCEDSYQDYHALTYLDKATEYGIHTNSKLDNLVTESAKAKKLILGTGRPNLYDANYGKFIQMSREYRNFLYNKCNYSDKNQD